MTREEAITVLNMVEAHGIAEEAKQMAISALQQEPCDDAISRPTVVKFEGTNMACMGGDEIMKEFENNAKEPCAEKTISLNAVIQTLNKMDRYTATELTLCDTDKKFPANEVFIVDDVYEQIAEQLPSVTPSRHKGLWIDKTEWYECSECGESHSYCHKYCPYCGAEMK